MKVKVFTTDKLNVVELKKVLDIMRTSKSPNDSFNSTFPERYRGLTKVSKKQTNVYFDHKNANAHVYEIEA